jgi:hypothetical protein
VDVPSFLQAATAFVNDKCFGTLSVGLSIHPSTQKRYTNELHQAISDLRYGAIVVNHTRASLAHSWPLSCFTLWCRGLQPTSRCTQADTH